MTTLIRFESRFQGQPGKGNATGFTAWGASGSGPCGLCGQARRKTSPGEGWLLGFQVDSGRYLMEKGSVAVDGVSLTVNRVQDRRFWVMIIPHTVALTGLTEKKINDKVNVEFDLIGKYIEKFVSSRGESSGVNEDILKEHGFM